MILLTLSPFTWKIKRAALQEIPSARILAKVKTKLTPREWMDDLLEYERTHPIAFASPRALMEARLIAEVDKARRPHRLARRNGVARRRKAVAG